MTVYVQPNSSVNLQLGIVGMTTYGNNLPFLTSDPISVAVNFRSCVSGEVLTSSLACEACPNGTILYTVPTEPSVCSACDVHAVCYGKNVSSPMPGYWRANDSS